MGNIEITTKLSRLKSVSSIDNDYLEAATGGVPKNFVNLQENTCVGVCVDTPKLVFSFECQQIF